MTFPKLVQGENLIFTAYSEAEYNAYTLIIAVKKELNALNAWRDDDTLTGIRNFELSEDSYNRVKKQCNEAIRALPNDSTKRRLIEYYGV